MSSDLTRSNLDQIELSDAERSLCQELALTPQDEDYISQMAVRYSQEPGHLLKYVAAGITVSRLNECLRIKKDIRGCRATPIPVLSKCLDKVHECNKISPNIELPKDKVLVMGYALTTQEYEDYLTGKLILSPQPYSGSTVGYGISENISLNPPTQDEVLSLLSSAAPLSKILEWTNNDLSGDILEAYLLARDDKAYTRKCLSNYE